jgi:chromosome segregation ATPase
MYRIDNPAVAQLESVVNARETVQGERVRTRRNYDELARKADDLGQALVEAEREIERLQGGGARVAVASLLGGGEQKLPEMRRVADELRAEHVKVTAELEALAKAERALESRLAEIAVADTQLTQLKAERLAAMRRRDDGVGAELRAVDAAVQAADERIAALDSTLVAADRVATDAELLVELAAQWRKVSGGRAVLQTTADVFRVLDGQNPILGADRETVRARLNDHLPLLRDSLEALVPRVGHRQEPSARQLEALAKAELETLAREGVELLACVEQLRSSLVRERGTVQTQRAELVARES